MLAKIPLWVFAVLALLVYLGYRQSRTRLVSSTGAALLAMAMLGLSLYGVLAAFGVRPVPLLAWVLGISASVAWGSRVFGPRGMVRAAPPRSVELPGSWIPLGLMLGIFTVKFVLGVAAGVGSDMVNHGWFIAATSLAFGLLSGGFAARALAVHRFSVKANGNAQALTATEFSP